MLDTARMEISNMDPSWPVRHDVPQAKGCELVRYETARVEEGQSLLGC